MAAPVSEDPEELRIADQLKALLRERGYTHDSFAAEAGVSAGRVSQWATNRGGVPPERASRVAQLLGVGPADVSLGWRRLRDEFAASQPAGLDLAKLTSLLETLEAAIQKSGREVPANTKARLIVSMYADEQALSTSTKVVEAELAKLIASMERS